MIDFAQSALSTTPSPARMGSTASRRIALWELTGPLKRHVTDGVRDDVLSAEAVPIWYFSSDAPPPVNRYADASQCTRTTRVYHVTAIPSDQRDQILALTQGQAGDHAIPRFDMGDWVYAQFNPQSGRWELLATGENLWRFELSSSLAPSSERDVPSTALAWLVVFDPAAGRYVRTTVQFRVADYLHAWTAAPGARGYARRLADSHRHVGWEVLVVGP